MSKAPYVILALVLLFALVFFGWAVFSSKQPVPSSSSSSSSSSLIHKTAEKPITLTGLEIAKRTATFLDKSQQGEAVFLRIFNCDPRNPDKCQPGKGPNFTWLYNCDVQTPSKCQPADDSRGYLRLGYIALAYYELYQKTKDPAYLQKANPIIEYTLTCQEFETFCGFSYPLFYLLYKDTSESRYKEAMLRYAQSVMSKEPLGTYVLSSYGSRLAMLYEVTGDKQYLQRLKEITSRLLAGEFDNNPQNTPLYQEGDKTIGQYDVWVVWDFYIPAYKVTKDPKYLKAAQDYFDNANTTAHIADFKTKDNSPDLNTLEALLDLADISDEPKKSQYKKQAETLAQAMLLDLWDSAENPKFNGDYGFLSMFTKDKNVKKLNHSAWRVREFLRMSDTVFKLQ